MKKQILLASTLFFYTQSNLTFSQIIVKQRKVVPVITPQKFYLNGGFRASLGGVSRQTIKVTLPANTVEWYYAVSVSPSSSNTSINLNEQIIGLLDPTGLSSLLVNQIMVPAGSGMCTTYLFDEKNAALFLQKVDNNGGRFVHWREASRDNFTAGVVAIKNPNLQRGSFYLGVKNPSTSTGMNITLEVSAIVDEEVTNDLWSIEQKNSIFNGLLTSIKEWDEFKSAPEYRVKEVASCVTKELTKTLPSKYSALAEFEQEELAQKAIEKCVK